MQQRHKRRRRWLGALWILGLILGLFPKAYAQGALSSKNDFVNTYQWDVSLDLYQLFRNGGANVMLRYAPDTKGAYRFALDGGINKFESTWLGDTLTNSTYVQNVVNIGIRTGYEWHKNMNRHQFFYGTDVEFTFRSNRAYWIGSGGPGFAPSRDYILSLQPFAGVKYRLLDHLSVSAECSLSLSFFRRNILESDKKTIVNKAITSSVGFIPLRFLNISYHF